MHPLTRPSQVEARSSVSISPLYVDLELRAQLLGAHRRISYFNSSGEYSLSDGYILWRSLDSPDNRDWWGSLEVAGLRHQFRLLSKDFPIHKTSADRSVDTVFLEGKVLRVIDQCWIDVSQCVGKRRHLVFGRQQWPTVGLSTILAKSMTSAALNCCSPLNPTVTASKSLNPTALSFSVSTSLFLPQILLPFLTFPRVSLKQAEFQLHNLEANNILLYQTWLFPKKIHQIYRHHEAPPLQVRRHQ